MRGSWLTEEQLQLREMLARRLSAGLISVSALSELGAWGATIPPAYGGLGCGVTEAAIVSEALGKARIHTPFIETVILGGGLIAALGSEAQRERWLPRIAAGSLTVAIAFAEPLRLDVLDPAVSSRSSAGGYRLDGIKAPVAWAPNADLIIVNAKCGDGVSVYAIERSLLPMSPSYQSVDGLAAASIEMSCVVPEGTLLGKAGCAAGALEEAMDRALIVQAAEQVGLMAHLIESTVSYLKQRRQFGVTLSSFQALRHRVAEMLLAYEKAVSMIVQARLRSAETLTPAPRRATLGAALMATKAAQLVGHEAIQMHGAVGITEELSIGPAVRRIYALESRLGPIEKKLARYARELYGR